MSVRPSVRPSVRVFRTFLQHALRYQFETWYIHSVGGTTCRVRVASQLGHFYLVYSQKEVKPIFFNQGLINQDKFFKFGTKVACCILLDISSVFCKNIIFRILAIIFVRFGFFEVFRAFFLHVLRYQFETWFITWFVVHCFSSVHCTQCIVQYNALWKAVVCDHPRRFS